jgi:DNA-binding PadR family transcriptional regulator
MPLTHAVLGLLVERAGDADDLAQRLRNRFAGWEPTRTAVFDVLNQLRQESLIRVRRRGNAAVPGRRSADTYEPTVEGTRRFNAWMEDSPTYLVSGDELKARIALMQPHHVPRVHITLREQRRRCIDRMRRLIDASRAAAPAGHESWQVRRDQLTHRVEMIHLHAMMVTVEDCLDGIEPFLTASRANTRTTRDG